jgi:hypothetical protein
MSKEVARIFLRFLGLLSFSAVVCCGQVLWDRSARGIADRGITVPVGEFSRERIIKMSRETLLAKPTDTVLYLTIMSADFPRFLFHQTSHERYERLFRTLDEYKHRRLQIAELASFGQDAVLRIRDGNTVERIVLAGRDPLIYEAGSERCEILYFRLHTVSSLASVYARCVAGLTVDTVNGLYEQIKRRVPVHCMLQVRTDSWFLSLYYPVMYWYDVELPPAPDALIKAPTVICGLGDRNTGCGPIRPFQ